MGHDKDWVEPAGHRIQLPVNLEPRALTVTRQLNGTPTGAWQLGVCSVTRVQCCDPTDCSPPGPSVHRIYKAGILECVAWPREAKTWAVVQFLELSVPSPK